jgi:IS5 family transposase
MGDGRLLKPMVKKGQKDGEVKRALADGRYDSTQNFKFLAEEGVDPAKTQKNHLCNTAKTKRNLFMTCRRYASESKWNLQC